MTANFWLTVSQTVVFLAVCSFAWWAARLLAEAANSSALAAQEAVKAANDAQRTATDIREMRDMLRAWLDHHEQRVGRSDDRPAQDAPASARPARTDTAEAQAVLTPQAITGGAFSVSDKSLGDASRSRRGRHASDPDPGWTSALVAVASRTASRIKFQEGERP